MNSCRRSGRVAISILTIALLPLVGQSSGADSSKEYPREYAFFRAAFERRNGTVHQNDLDRTFKEVVIAVERLQRCAPKITLGGMLSLVIFESGARLAFYNTKDQENSFRKRLRADLPFWQQPFARYSYQFGIVPVHTSILRPCMPGTQPLRKAFDEAALRAGFTPSEKDLESVRPEFDEVCGKVIQSRVPDKPRAVDYYILNSHRDFDVPKNSSGSDLKNLGRFPFFTPAVTTPLFFHEMETDCRTIQDDGAAICAWGGGDKSYCTKERQDAILASWAASVRR